MQQHDLITGSQAARIAGISRTQVGRLAASGDFPLRSNFLRASSCGIALKCRRGQTGTVNKTRQILSMMSKAKSTSPAMAFVASGFLTRLSGAFEHGREHGSQKS